jgi:spermidine synthase
MPTQLMLGHLPLLVHQDPKGVLVIGLGSGITAGAVARHPIERLDIVEIEPAVVEAARFFAGEHGDVLKNSRVRTVIADGRNFLLTTSHRYDVIISEPSNPWIGGLASLFSVEFFQLVRQRLEPGGVMLQWVQAYNLLPEDLRMVVKTFRTVFPATSIWSTTPGDLLLLGRTEPRPLDLKLVEGRFPHIRPDRLGLGIQGWSGVLGYFMLGEEDTKRFSETARLNTDDRLPLEFSAPRALYLDTVMGNRQLLRSFKVAEFPDLTPGSREALDRPDVRYWIGAAYLSRGMLEDALSQFQQALQFDPEHERSLLGATRAHLGLHRPAEALGLAQRVITRQPLNADAFYLAGLASRALNATTEAAAFFERAANLQPQNAQFRRALGPVVGASGSPH